MGLQFVRLTKESAYNTFPTSPAGGTQIDLYLSEDNAMGVRPMPQFWEIRDAGVGNRIVRRKPGRVTVGGPFGTPLFPSQTLYLLDLASTLVGSAPCMDLASFSIDHAITRDFNCGTDYRRYTGNKIAKLTLKSGADASGWLWYASGDIVGATPRAITGTDFPIPALSAYPSDDPYQFYHSAGHVSINGGTRTNYTSLQIDISNDVTPFADENLYASDVKWFGRTVTFSITTRYKSSADRLAYEAGTTQAASIELDNGVHTVTFNFGNQTIIDSVTDGLPRNGFFMQTLTFTALMDSTLSPANDFTFTVT